MIEGTALGTLVELMVEAEILAGSGGRLIASRMEPDVDHRDLVVAEESARLLYLVGLLDLQQHLLARLWLVPSADFNRLAYRERSSHADRITLQFSCRTAGDERWDSFEVPRLDLAARLEPLVSALGAAPIEELSSLRSATLSET
jgi:hypothetical protein